MQDYYDYFADHPPVHFLCQSLLAAFTDYKIPSQVRKEQENAPDLLTFLQNKPGGRTEIIKKNG